VNTTTQRIITAAIDRIRDGAEPISAIEDAAERVATTPAARERARRLALSFLARAERGGE